jgi:ABC-type transporter Mla MlaB component
MQTTATGTSEDDDFIAGRNSEVLTYMKLGLSNGSKNYRTDIYINDNASLGLDLGYDATIWNNTIPNFALYSNLVEEHTGKAMAIQTINNANMSNVTIPLGIKTSGSQSLTFSILESTLPQTSQVYLEDTETNIVTLLNVGNYNINTTNSYSGSGRFFLRIVDSALSIIVEELERINLYTNQTNKQILIKGQLTQNTTLKLYDMQGRLVKTVALQTARNIQSVDASLLSGGIYVVHLSNNQVELTKKIILK